MKTNVGTIDRDSVLTARAYARMQQMNRDKIERDLKVQFINFRTAKELVRKRNARYVALNGVHQALLQRLPYIARGDEERAVLLMLMGAAVERIFRAKNERHFEKLFESEWREDWS